MGVLAPKKTLKRFTFFLHWGQKQVEWFYG